MELNHFFSTKRLIFFISIIAGLILYVAITFGKLAFTPLPPETIPRTKIQRGSILDSNGKPLAVQTNFYHLVVTPSAVNDKNLLASTLAPLLEMTTQEILNQINNSTANFLYLKKRMDENMYEKVADAIKAKNIKGTRFDKIAGRIYPENDLASQVIGFMGDDGIGLSGIEYTMQDILSPENVPGETEVFGKNIYLTIDGNLQYKLEKIAKEAMQTTQAESFMLIAAEAKTGEIISYISLPEANLNTYTTSTPAERIDRPATYAYEPGSVFKVFSSSIFLQSGGITPNSTFYCDGKYEVHTANETATINCLGVHGTVTVREALQYSCNDGISQMSETINSTDFMTAIKKLGFGSKTGIELPSETKGLVKSPTDKLWSIRSKPTISIGQEISVSALQMVQSATAIANKGIPVKLSLISRIVDKDGTIAYQHQSEYKEPIFSSNVTDYLLSCMETTAKYGTGTKALLGDVSIGVKTGTAQMTDPVTGAYSDTDFVSNCLAFFPIDDPEIILYIVIMKAQGETYAGRIVAPVISDAANIIIDHLGFARSSAPSITHSGKIQINSAKAVELGNTVPNFIGLPKRSLLPMLDRTDIKISIQGDGWVVSQSPKAGTPVTENMIIELQLE